MLLHCFWQYADFWGRKTARLGLKMLLLLPVGHVRFQGDPTTINPYREAILQKSFTYCLDNQCFGSINTPWTNKTSDHYGDVIMGAITSHITSLTIVYSTVNSEADQRKHQSSASLAFVRGIHRGPVNSPHKWPITRKMFPFDDGIMMTRWLDFELIYIYGLEV